MPVTLTTCDLPPVPTQTSVPDPRGGERLTDARDQWLHEECIWDFNGYVSPGHFPVSFWADTYRRQDGSRVIVCGGDWSHDDGTARILPYSPELQATLEAGNLNQFAAEQALEAAADAALAAPTST